MNEYDLIRQTFAEVEELLRRKGHDYSGDDHPYRNLYFCEHLGVDARRGILIRMLDKIGRIHSLLDRNDPQVANESIEDTVKDLIGYAVLLLIIHRQKIGGSHG